MSKGGVVGKARCERRRKEKGRRGDEGTQEAFPVAVSAVHEQERRRSVTWARTLKRAASGASQLFGRWELVEDSPDCSPCLAPEKRGHPCVSFFFPLHLFLASDLAAVFACGLRQPKRPPMEPSRTFHPHTLYSVQRRLNTTLLSLAPGAGLRYCSRHRSRQNHNVSPGLPPSCRPSAPLSLVFPEFHVYSALVSRIVLRNRHERRRPGPLLHLGPSRPPIVPVLGRGLGH